MPDLKISELPAITTLADADALPLVQAGVTSRMTAAQLKAYVNTFSREELTANRTYYVRTDGNNGNTGLVNNAGGAFLTIQQAIDTAVAFDLGPYTITIQVADGTYTTPVTLKSYLAAGGGITLQGNTTTPANCVIAVTNNTAITNANALGSWIVQGFKLQATTSGYGLVATGNAYLNASALDFGACANGHLLIAGGAYCGFVGAYTISGNAPVHVMVQNAEVFTAGQTLTFSGAITFAVAFSVAQIGGLHQAYGMTFVGTFTGSRYSASLNGVIFVNGAASTYFPGTVAGSTATGGQYG